MLVQVWGRNNVRVNTLSAAPTSQAGITEANNVWPPRSVSKRELSKAVGPKVLILFRAFARPHSSLSTPSLHFSKDLFFSLWAGPVTAQVVPSLVRLLLNLHATWGS